LKISSPCQLIWQAAKLRFICIACPDKSCMSFNFLLIGFCLILSCCQTAFAASLSQQRLYYSQAKSALVKGDSKPYKRYAKALSGYPLVSYLAYDELTNRLKYASNEEIEAFLLKHADLPQINWMKLRWLRWLAERGEWATFAKHYSTDLNFSELDCLYAHYLMTLPDKKAGMAAAKKLWLVGKSQPEACDGMFELWRKAGGLTEQQVWQRAVLAAEAGSYSLARYLTRDLKALQIESRLLLEVAQKPRTVTYSGRFARVSPAMGDVIALGLRRLLREDSEKALSLLNQYAKKQRFSEPAREALARSFGLALAKRFDSRALELINKYAPASTDEELSQWRIRLLLRLGRFTEAHQRIKYLPKSLADTSRWRYWRARSLQLAQPNNQEVNELYKVLAAERGFYEFMAADSLKQPLQLNHRPLPGSTAALKKVKSRPPVRRALEFFARGEDSLAWHEWYNAVNHLPQNEQVALARLAHDRSWYFQSIRTLSQAEYWDDLELRFPMPYRNKLQQMARNRELHPSWVFAIARQESAFRSDARSSAGALGLMQLMPRTARETARRFNIPLRRDKDILIPNTNIALGAAYLSQLQRQFNGNRILASAAYNAGASRVRNWLKDAEHVPWDIWVENIPFDETRQYVQNVLTYAVIYGHRLNMPIPLLQTNERSLKTN